MAGDLGTNDSCWIDSFGDVGMEAIFGDSGSWESVGELDRWIWFDGKDE